jgi:hypothetical protein
MCKNKYLTLNHPKAFFLSIKTNILLKAVLENEYLNLIRKNYKN